MEDILKKKFHTVDECGGYWKEAPWYPVEDWVREVVNGDTREGYWESAMARREEKEGEEL